MQHTIAGVLRTLGARTEGNASLEPLNEAVAAYGAALEVRTRDAIPAEWAATQFELGLALHIIGERANETVGTEALNAAVAAYRAALEVRTRETMPDDWAATQDRLALVLNTIGGARGRRRGDRGV